MHIGIDARMWGPEQTGIGRYVDRLLFHLARVPHRHHMTIFALDRFLPRLAEVVGERTLAGHAIRFVPVRDRWYGWGEQVRLPIVFLRERLNLLHVPHFNAPVGYRRPFVVTIHDLTPWRFPGHRMGRSVFRRAAFRRVFASAARRARTLIAVSQSTADDVRRTVGRKDVRVIYEGPGFYDRDDAAPSRVATADVYATPFVLALGVWRDHKNFARLIEAFALLRDEGADISLVLGGSWRDGDPQTLAALRTSPARPFIVTPGFFSSEVLPSWYRAARVVAVPSLAEGFGFVGLEAMACGTPVVASRAGALPEVYGNAALFVDPMSSRDIADGLRRALDDASLRATLVENGKRRLAQYSWRRMAEETLRVYEEALGGDTMRR